MYIANRCHEAKLYQATDQTRGKVGAVRIVADIFGKFFFAAVCRREACLNGYLAHGVAPKILLHYLMGLWEPGAITLSCNRDHRRYLCPDYRIDPNAAST